jgi:uncharacterized surface protein with fasciclin (FAS1) repeats
MPTDLNDAQHSGRRLHAFSAVFPDNKESAMKRLLASFASTIIFALGASNVWAADIIDTASTAATLKTFLAAMKETGFTNTLKNTGPYTVFAPSDAAFEKLPPDTLKTLMSDKAKLARVLAHLVIPGKVLVAEVKPGKVKTLEGDLLRITSDNGMITVDDARVTQSDMVADNGVIHEIDTVVLDPLDP